MEKVEGIAKRAALKAYPISILVVAAVAYYANIALTREGAENTRISEHALMPGIVIPTFDKDVQEMKWLNEILKRKNMQSRAEYIANEMNIFSIDSSLHYWQKSTPFKKENVTTHAENYDPAHNGSIEVVHFMPGNYTGVSTVSMLRAYRSTGAELMIVATRMEDSHAVAMLMALAYHSREHSYWSRDVIFIFVEGGEKGMDAWLEEYYGVKEDKEGEEIMRGRGRFVVGAIVLETPDHLSREYILDLRVNGMNGQLPNLDLFNSIARIAHRGRNQLNIVIYPQEETRVEGNNGMVPFRFLLNQAFNGVEGIHSVFSKYGVQAVTIRGPRNRSGNVGRTEYVMEGIMRSLNNLHERFHQSYFLYILISPGTFSSIAFYLPLVGALIVPLAIFALREWFSLQSSFRPTASLSFLLVYGIGCLLLIDPLARLTQINEDGMIRLIILFLSLPIGLAIKIDCLPSSRVVVLLSISLLLGSLSLLNFALALFSSLAILPAVLITVAPATTRLEALTRTLLLIPLNPLALILLGRLAMISIQYDWWSHADHKLIEWGLLVGGPEYLLSTVYRLMDELFTVGTWHLPMLLILAAPIWNSLLALASTVDDRKVEN